MYSFLRRHQRAIFKIAGASLVVVFLPLALGFIDYSRIGRGKRPLCSLYVGGFRDGGTRCYIGWGYIIFSAHVRTREGIVVGPRMLLWFLIPCDNTRLQPYKG